MDLLSFGLGILTGIIGTLGTSFCIKLGVLNLFNNNNKQNIKAKEIKNTEIVGRDKK